MEDWVTIRNIKAKNPKFGTRRIAEILGISRNTVKKALQSDKEPQYQRKETLNESITPFAEFIETSYLVKELKVSRILKDMQSKGYAGSQAALYRHINKTLKPKKESASARAFRSYSTDPGEQMQYDWAEYIVQIDHTSVKIYVHQTILGYSRYKSFDVSLSINQSDVFTALEESFHLYGGVCERIQVDNAKVFIDNASKENLVWNRRFLHFCGFYSIKPTRSLPRHPWSKGKVEKPFDYLENHFIVGNEFQSFEELRHRLKSFQERVNEEYHTGIKQPPIVLFDKENIHLKPLPVHPVTGEIKRYIGFKEEFRKVTADCMIAYKGNRYSVPYHFASSEVWVKVLYGVTLQVFSTRNKLIASHQLSLKKGEVILNKEHFKGYRVEGTSNITVSIAALVKRFVHYSNIHDFITNVKVQKRINPGHHLHKIVTLFEYYSDEECIAAMEECFTYNVFNATVVKGYISALPPKEEPLPNLFNIDLPEGDVKRDLGAYDLKRLTGGRQ